MIHESGSQPMSQTARSSEELHKGRRCKQKGEEQGRCPRQKRGLVIAGGLCLCGMAGVYQADCLSSSDQLIPDLRFPFWESRNCN